MLLTRLRFKRIFWHSTPLSKRRAEQQQVAVSQILIAVQQMDAVTQGSAAASEENAAAAEELSAQGAIFSNLATRMLALVNGARSTREEPVQTAGSSEESENSRYDEHALHIM